MKLFSVSRGQRGAFGGWYENHIGCNGADKPARELIRGAILAKEEYDTDIVLVGDETVIREALTEEQAPDGSFEIVHAGDVVTMEDEPMSIFQTHKESSMAKTLKLVAEGYGDAAVSAGNTGAYFTGATLIVKLN